jgi:hypothetical protein
MGTAAGQRDECAVLVAPHRGEPGADGGDHGLARRQFVGARRADGPQAVDEEVFGDGDVVAHQVRRRGAHRHPGRVVQRRPLVVAPDDEVPQDEGGERAVRHAPLPEPGGHPHPVAPARVPADVRQAVDGGVVLRGPAVRDPRQAERRHRPFGERGVPTLHIGLRAGPVVLTEHDHEDVVVVVRRRAHRVPVVRPEVHVTRRAIDRHRAGDDEFADRFQAGEEEAAVQDREMRGDHDVLRRDRAGVGLDRVPVAAPDVQRAHAFGHVAAVAGEARRQGAQPAHGVKLRLPREPHRAAHRERQVQARTVHIGRR